MPPFIAIGAKIFMINPCKLQTPVDRLADRVDDAPRRVRKRAGLSTRDGARTRRKANADEAARFSVRWLPVDALAPDSKNARVHSARQVARIADSIAAFGFNVRFSSTRKAASSRVMAGSSPPGDSGLRTYPRSRSTI